jgi:cobalt-precorrin-5B (C1)-methyltransferase
MSDKTRKLRTGYTTGTCAAAAAKAAAAMLFSGKKISRIEIALPSDGKKAQFTLTDQKLDRTLARCCIIKDAGDDPDVTHNAKVCATVEENGNGGGRIVLNGGKGVGTVTKRGLQVEVGEAAINPVPRKMILYEVKKVLPEGKSVKVTIHVPKGRELSKKTMNGKLGIVNGISILGTTGIVEPRSKEAFKASLLPQIDVAMANGFDEVVLTPGNIGERNAVGRGMPEDAVILMANFVGFMLEACADKGIEKVLLFGHIGKLCKLAGGMLDTHSSKGDNRLEVIAAHARKLGTNRDILELITDANTTETALEILQENGLGGRVFDSIAKSAGIKAFEHTCGKLVVGTALLSFSGEIVGKYNIEGTRWAKYL